MSDYHIKAAYEYYANHINRLERFSLLRLYRFPIAGSVHPIDWELFGSILTGDKGKQGYGADLVGHEIKSAVIGSSFEYQYHLYSGLKKLKEDKEVQHIFISYSKDYKEVIVRIISGHILATLFDAWEPALERNYQGDQRKQRFRKSVSYGFVMQHSTMIMHISDGLLQFPSLEIYSNPI